MLPSPLALAADEEPFQVEVNILSAAIKAGETPIGHVPRGTKLTAYQFNGSFYLVDLPGTDPRQQGWIAKDDVHRVADDLAELKQRIAALPDDQQQQAWNEAAAKLQANAARQQKYLELYRDGRSKEAPPLAEQYAADTKELVGDKSAVYAEALYNLGLLARENGDYPAARKHLEQALAIRREVVGEKNADTAEHSRIRVCRRRHGGLPAGTKVF